MIWCVSRKNLSRWLKNHIARKRIAISTCFNFKIVNRKIKSFKSKFKNSPKLIFIWRKRLKISLIKLKAKNRLFTVFYCSKKKIKVKYSQKEYTENKRKRKCIRWKSFISISKTKECRVILRWSYKKKMKLMRISKRMQRLQKSGKSVSEALKEELYRHSRTNTLKLLKLSWEKLSFLLTPFLTFQLNQVRL